MTPLTPEEKALASLVEKALKALVNAVDAGALKAAVANKNIGQIKALLDSGAIAKMGEAAQALIAKEIVTEAGKAAKAMGITMNLSSVDPNVIAAARASTGRLIVAISEAARQTIESIVVTSFATQALTVDDVARLIFEVVGPTPRVATAIMNAYTVNLTTALASGMAYDKAKAKADKALQVAATRARKSRARTIARTEMMTASNFGRYLTWHEANGKGLIPDGMRKQWITAPEGSRYGPPCPICLPLAGMTIGWEDNFPTGDPMPPAHPNCRCTAVLRAPETASVA